MVNITILIVEDEVIVAENIRNKLEHMGYTVPEIVTSGEQAIQSLVNLPVDLVLMDIELEGEMDGIDTAEYIHAQYNIPIIYLTAYADDEILRRARVTEPFSYLLKPFQTRELQSNIEMAIYKHQMEKMLKASEERYRRITDVITDYVYTVQVHDGQAVETHHSPACVAVTGYTEEEFQQNPHLWLQMVCPEDRSLVVKQAEHVLTGREVKPLEHRIHRKDETIRWVKNTPVLHHNNEGTLVSYDGLIQDITERKESEFALKEERVSLAQRVEETTYHSLCI